MAGCNLLTGAADLAIGDDAPTDPGAVDAGDLPAPDGGPGPRDTGADVATDRGASDARVDADADAGPVLGAKHAFITSTRRTGDMNGIAGGDMACGSLAAGAGLGGKWVAWLSTQGGVDAVDRLTHDGPWYLVDRMTLAVASKAQLTGATITHPIDRDEKGVAVEDEAWTGTRNGRASNSDCNGWNSVQIPVQGTTGKSDQASADWTASGDSLCATQQRLYCFEN